MIAVLSVSATLILLVCILTRNVRVSIIREREWKVILNFTFLTVPLKKRLNKSKDKGSPKGKKGRKRETSVVLPHVLDALTHSSLEIRRLSFPTISGKSDISAALLSSWRYSSIIFALLALLHSRTKSLTVGDNAITLNSDGDFFIDISITIRLFHVILTYLAIIHDKKDEKRKGVIAS